MADEHRPVSTQPNPEPHFESPESQGRGPWIGIGAGLLVVLVTIAALFYFSRTDERRPAPLPPIVPAAGSVDPYAENLEVSQPQLSAASNFVGGVSTYVEGTLTNTGAETVTGATVEVTFRNTQGDVVQRQVKPLLIVTRRQPTVDVVALNQAPLAPGQNRQFRLTFENVAADWNRAYPDMRFVSVQSE